MFFFSKSFESTDWKTIAALYARLLQGNPNPFVELNYAIALYYSGDSETAFKILKELERHSFLNQYYLFNMTLGKFNHLEGDDHLAKQFFEKAYDQTQAGREKEFIQNMSNKLDLTA